ncbi:hypothetical protein C0989_010081, partial [Termitomyces sp. Mn162]
AFYAPSISQGILLGWRHPPAFSTNGNNPRMYPGGYSAALPNPAYLSPTHYYAYPVPAAAPTPLGPMDNYSPPWNLLETTQGTLGIDDNLRNELHALVKEIHTSLNPCPFEDSLDPAHSFHVQRKEPIGTESEALPSIPHQQEELNAASSILRNFNPAGGLFDQPAAHTLALSTCPQANSVPSAFQTWDQLTVFKPCSQWLPPHVNDDN